MKLSKLLLAVVAASVLFGAFVANASARNVSSSSQRLRATFREVRFTGGFGTTICAVTLEGTLHSRTIAKVRGQLIGYINAATLGACQTGAATILRETLPWHVTYAGFDGTLPNFTALRTDVINSSFRISEPVFGITCLARSEAAQPATGTYNREARGSLTTAVIGGTVTTSCGANGTLSGTSNSLTTGAGTSTRITVTLI